MGDHRRLLGLNHEEFERHCLRLVNRLGRAAMTFHRRGASSDADQGVDIEGVLDGRRCGFQCKTGRVGPRELDNLAKALTRYPHALDRLVLLCAQSPTPAGRDRFAELRDTLRTAAGPIKEVELWGPDELEGKFGPPVFDDAATVAAFERHSQWLLDQYYREQVWDLTGTPLQQIYVELDCGQHTWGELAASSSKAEGLGIDPFAEHSAARQDLLTATLDWIARPDHQQFIVVQGTPGAGKSSFTIRLAAHLAEHGYQPVRARLRDLSIEDDPLSAIAATSLRLDRPSFMRALEWHDRTIVLILDGWDELPHVPGEQFDDRIGAFMEKIRGGVFHRSEGRVKVVLTGRPSDMVTRWDRLTSDTPILTIRPLTPPQLRTYFGKLETIYATSSKREVDLDAVLRRYQVDWNVVRREGTGAPSSTIDVIGWPMLAHLAVRLLMECEPAEQATLIHDRTKLLRCVTEYCCQHSRYASDEPGRERVRTRFPPEQLRALVHEAAIAITATGRECIALSDFRQEMEARMNAAAVDTSIDLAQRVDVLLVNFLFKTGFEHLGCEFVHKGLREFAFAEALVDALKQFADVKAPSPSAAAEERKQTRNFMRLLDDIWLENNLWEMVHDQLAWDVCRENPAFDDPAAFRRQESALGIDGWCRVRDRLAAIWKDWAGFGGGSHRYDVDDTTVGSALFQLCAAIHGMVGVRLLELNGVPVLKKCIWEKGSVTATDNPHQRSSNESSDPRLRFFSPFNHGMGRDGWMVRSTLAKLNTYRDPPHHELPGHCDLTLLVLIDAPLQRLSFRRSDLRFCNLSGSNLSGCDMEHVEMNNASLAKTNLSLANLGHADLRRSIFRDANLEGARLSSATLAGADFRGAKGLTVDQVLQAADWRTAKFDRDFEAALKARLG